MGSKGHMSIFFSMSILCICALLFALVESARMEGAKCYLQMAVNSAIDSVFSQYHRGIWDRYRLLFVEYETQEEITSEFKKFLNPYLEAKSWYPMTDEQTVVLQMQSAVDSGGDYLEKEILDYMKYGVWDMDFQPEQLKPLYQDTIEAETVQGIAGIYRKIAKDAWRIEQSLELLGNCLEQQKTHLKMARRSLQDYDGSRFCKETELLIEQLKRVPPFIKTYEKQADQLLKEVQENRLMPEARETVLSDSTKRKLEHEMEGYRAYIAGDEKRRMEIAELKNWAEAQLAVAGAALEEAREVMKMIADWKDEETSPDYESLWGNVEDRLNMFREKTLFAAHGIEDKEKQNRMVQAEAFFNPDLLGLILPEGTNISDRRLHDEELPSRRKRPSLRRDDILSEPANRLLVTTYCGTFFSDFRTAAEDEKKDQDGLEQGNERPLYYELEYLFAGEMSEEKNMEKVVKHLLLQREGMNLMHIMSDGQKMEEARALAALIVGAAGIAPLIPITTFFIISLWALGEAVIDLRLLLDGKSVPLVKKTSDWKLSLEDLLLIGQEGKLPQKTEGKEGLTYQSYLKLLLFFTERERLYYRMMDVIQVNLRQKDDYFRMENARYRLDIKETTLNHHLFFLPGFFRLYNKETNQGYRSQAVTQKAY